MRRRRPTNHIKSIAVILAGSCVILAAGIILFPMIRDGIQGVEKHGLIETPDQTAVRQYLKDHLHNPKYHVVEWSESVPAKQANKAWEKGRAISLRFRGYTQQGGMRLVEWTFHLEGGEVADVMGDDLEGVDWGEF